MPSSVRPDLPPAVEDAVTAFGHPARTAILGYLRIHGASTRGELATELALVPKTIQYHVGILARVGVLEADPPAARSGQRTRYTLVESRIAQLHAALTRHLGLEGGSNGALREQATTGGEACFRVESRDSRGG